MKFFAYDTGIFSTIPAVSVSAKNLDLNPKKVADWTFKWEMSFDPDKSKQVKEVIFSRKVVKPSHPVIKFNNMLMIMII